MRAHEFIIMPQTIKPMGLVHKPGVGNNKANEEAAGVGIVTKQNTTPDVNGKTLNKMLRNLHLIK